MKEITLIEQKEIMLNILKEFANFCESHNLRYFLDAGTLLGAIRHKGYIPWDDDIDVGMPRADYDRFCEILEKQNDKLKEHIYLERPGDTIYPFLKIGDDRTLLVEFPDRNPIDCRVYIDVFPKDGLKDLDKKSKRLCRKSEILGDFFWFNKFSIFAWKNESNPIKRIIAFFGRKLIKHPNKPLIKKQQMIENHNKKVGYDKSKYVTTLVNGEFNKACRKECFDKLIKVDFENEKFNAPIGYDEYLRCLYKGDYMQLPPEEKRVCHKTVVFWKEGYDYKKYKEEI